MIVVLFLLALPLVIGQIDRPSTVSEPVFEQGTDITISIPCTSNGSVCSPATNCYSTIINPEPTVLLNNQLMQKNSGVFEINLSDNQTEINGEYELNVYCSDGNGNSISRFLKFHITPNGELPSTARGLLYIGLFIILIIFFIMTIYGFMSASSLLGKFTLFHFAYLFLIAITFIAWNMSNDFFVSSLYLVSFMRLLWWVVFIAYFPLILVSFIWIGYMMLTIKQVKKLMESGVPEDEAYARVKGKRWT